MNQVRWETALVSVLLIVMASVSSAEVPLLINYRGYVDVSDPIIGLPTGALNVDLTFSLYDTIQIEGVTPLWTETQTVQLLDGNFAVILGSVLPLSLDLFASSQRYLSVSMNGIEVISPQLVLSVPYAIQAGNLYSADNGRVGIGTTNPGATLDVQGNIKASMDITTSGAMSASGAITSEGLVQSNSGGFKFPDGTTQTTRAMGDGYSLDAMDGEPADTVYVDATGQVGIGTTSPRSHLHISDTGSAELLIEADTDDDIIGDASDHPVLRFSQDGGLVQGRIGFLQGEDNVLGLMNEYPSVHSDLVFGTSDTERMRITADGRIGMGTDSPQADLQVAGSAIVDGTLDASHLRIAGERPFFLKWYTIPAWVGSTDTGISSEDYICVIAGFRALNGDINEGGAGDIMNVFLYPNTETQIWILYHDFRTHGQDENWRIAILGIRKDLVEDLGGTPW